MVEVLHREHPRVVAQERHDEVGATLGVGVAEGGEHLGEVEHRVEPGDPAAGARPRRALADGVDPDAALPEPVAERADDALEEGLRVAHLGVLREDALRADVGEGHDGAALGEGVLLEPGLDDPVERDGRDVERLEEPVVVEVLVGAVLADVHAHPDRVDDEVHRPVLGLHFVEERFELAVVRGVGVDDGAAGLLGEPLEAAEALGDGGVGEGERGALALARFGDLPGEAALVERAEDDAVLAGEEAVAVGRDGHRSGGVGECGAGGPQTSSPPARRQDVGVVRALSPCAPSSPRCRARARRGGRGPSSASAP